MNYTVQEFALQYAEAMVRFYQAQHRYYSTDGADGKNLDDIYNRFQEARDAMYNAQERLAAAAKRQAELLNAE